MTDICSDLVTEGTNARGGNVCLKLMPVSHLTACSMTSGVIQQASDIAVQIAKEAFVPVWKIIPLKMAIIFNVI